MNAASHSPLGGEGRCPSSYLTLTLERELIQRPTKPDLRCWPFLMKSREICVRSVPRDIPRVADISLS